ncbi:MAG: hypothetical protein FJ221_01485 [Lentisphaerae bacterium]|nr:hypothetical protein [Lentisphaerota bacterium]
MADEKTNGANGGDSASPIPPKIRLNLGQPGAKKPDTSRIDLAAAEPSTIETAGAGEALNVRDVLGKSPKTAVLPPVSATVKAQTSRISIHDSQPVAPGDAIPVAKASTSRIALRDSQRVPPFAAAAVPKAATSKVATGAIQAAGGPVEQITQQAALGRTARIMIDADETLPTGGSLGDTGKMTIPADVAAKATPPKTVRLQRPTAAPKTVILKRPDAGAAPKTVVLKRPEAPAEPAHRPVVAPPTQGPKTVQLNAAGEAEQKGATARISIPDGAVDTSAPPTQRKTIRIKRGGEGPATGAKTLVLQRPVAREEGEPGVEGIAEGATPAQIAEAELSRALGVQEVDEPGVGYGIVAILAFLVIGTLLYALLAQTYFPNLPMPQPMV